MRYFLAILLAIGIFSSGYAMAKRSPAQLAYKIRVDTLMRETVRLDTVWRSSKAKYAEALTKYDTVRMMNTVVKNDTVFIPRPVADSIVVACRAVVSVCESQKANLTARLAIAEESLKAAKRDPKRLIVAGTIGFVAGLLLR